MTVKIGMMTANSFKKVSLIMGASAVCVLAGCASKPAYNSTTGKGAGGSTQQIITDSKGVPNKYQVKQGDTVAKIAQRYGLNWRDVAQLNNLNSSYTIYTGQWLTLWTGTSSKPSAIQNPRQAASKPPVIHQATTVSTAPTAATSPASNAQSALPTLPTSTPSQTNHQTTPVATAPFATGSAGVMQFRYPVDKTNVVVRRFGVPQGTTTTQGMWFSGQAGDAIYASRDGVVIYADGKHVEQAVIAIEHTGGFASSYLYVKDVLVKSGESVYAGQRIASMKNQQGNTALFEFRIARNNVYVDPLTVLK